MPRISKNLENNVLENPILSKIIFYLAKKPDNSNGLALRDIGTTQGALYTQIKKLEKLDYVFKKGKNYHVNVNLINSNLRCYIIDFLNYSLDFITDLCVKSDEVENYDNSNLVTLKKALSEYIIDLEEDTTKLIFKANPFIYNLVLVELSNFQSNTVKESLDKVLDYLCLSEIGNIIFLDKELKITSELDLKESGFMYLFSLNKFLIRINSLVSGSISYEKSIKNTLREHLNLNKNETKI